MAACLGCGSLVRGVCVCVSATHSAKRKQKGDGNHANGTSVATISTWRFDFTVEALKPFIWEVCATAHGVSGCKAAPYPNWPTMKPPASAKMTACMLSFTGPPKLFCKDSILVICAWSFWRLAAGCSSCTVHRGRSPATKNPDRPGFSYRIKKFEEELHKVFFGPSR